MRAVLRDRRTGLPILAVFIGLVLTFAVPPLSRVVAAGSSSSASSMSSQSSPAQSCFSVVSLGSAAPGGKVSGTLAPSTQPGCAWVDGVTLSVNGDKRSGHTISKTPDANGQVSVSVAVKSQTQGVLDDPVDVTLQCGSNTVTAEGDTSEGVTSTADGDFTVVCGTTTTTTGNTTTTNNFVTPVTVIVTPLASPTQGLGLARTGLNVLALLLLGLMAIVLGTYTMASEHAVPVNATGTVGAVVPPWTQTVTARSWNWDIEAIALHAAALLLGPPAGRHIKYSGPRGLIPIIRDGITRPFGRTSS